MAGLPTQQDPRIQSGFRTSFSQLSRLGIGAGRQIVARGAKPEERLDSHDQRLEALEQRPEYDEVAWRAWYEELQKMKRDQQADQLGNPTDSIFSTLTLVETVVETTGGTLDLGNYRLRKDAARDLVVWEKQIGGVWTEISIPASRQ